MIYLILAILSSSTIVLLWKISEKKNLNTIRLMQLNYFFAVLLSFLLTRPTSIIINSSLIKLSFLAIPTGMIFVVSFFLYAKNIQVNGAIISSSLSKMGVLLPVMFSFLIFREILVPRQLAGLIIGLISLIIYFGFIPIRNPEMGKKNTLLLLFLVAFQGIAEMSNKLFSFFFYVSQKPMFLFILFLSAFFLTSIIAYYKKINLKKEEIIFGCLLGIPNFFSSYFLIDAFRIMKSAIVFTIFSMGSIFIVTLFSYLLFKERINKKQAIFLLSILVTIWLMQS